MPLHRRIHQPIATVKDGLSSLSPFPLHQYPPQRLALSRSRTRLQRFTHAINISSSLFVWIVVVCALLTALYDMAQQFIGSSRESKASDLIITFGTYLLVVSRRSLGAWGVQVSWRTRLTIVPVAGYHWAVHHDQPDAEFEADAREHPEGLHSNSAGGRLKGKSCTTCGARCMQT
jgi:hypothetical protein